MDRIQVAFIVVFALLVPILFQVVYANRKLDKLSKRLDELEKKKED